MSSLERESLDSLLDEWTADEAPEGFSRRAVEAARAERRVAGRGLRASGVVVPLLLAALLVSFGAAAAWGGLLDGTRDARVDEGEGLPVEKPTALSFHLSGQAGHAEREDGGEKVEPQKRPVSPATSRKSVAKQPAEEAHVEKPRVVHYPRCECSTAAVVCTCSD